MKLFIDAVSDTRSVKLLGTIGKAWLVIYCLTGVSPASGSQAVLERFFTDVRSMQAEFEQRVVDETGMILEESDGTFYLSRPGKFRWNYAGIDPAVPDGSQIVADGKHIFMFDPDLEQVTQRSLRDALAQVPSLVLVQEAGNIEDHFAVTDFGLTDGLSWVALKPRAEDAGFQQLMIGFRGVIIEQIVLLDGLGNETRLKLSDVIENPELNPGVFTFRVPDGADVLIQ